MPRDPGLLAPGQHRVGRQLSAVVADDHAGLAAPGDQSGELAHHPPARDRGVRHRR